MKKQLVVRSTKPVTMDVFFRQARHGPAAVWGIRQRDTTKHGGKRRRLMSLVWRNGLLASCLISIGLAWFPAHAADLDSGPPADLPPLAAVQQALAAQPMVRAAEAELRGAKAARDGLKAGEYEFGLSVGSQRRTLRGGPSYTEWNVAVERRLRLPYKASLDGQIGDQGVMAAEARIGDARHESARLLLSQWYAVRRASLEADLWRQQAELLKTQQRIVETRVKRGDAARLEQIQAEAALAQALSQGASAEAHQKVALAELQARYPELPAPDGQTSAPPKIEGNEASWQALTLEHNHELLMIQHELDKARLQTSRAEANRLPDPTLGLHAANEQGGNDKIVGVTLSLPWPGGGRHAQVQIQLAQVDALSEQEAAVRRRLVAESVANWQRATSGLEAWQRLEDATRAVAQHAALARRAYELGELGLSEALFAQRVALDSLLAAGQARLSANEAVARLLLDAHQLWQLERDGAGH